MGCRLLASEPLGMSSANARGANAAKARRVAAAAARNVRTTHRPAVDLISRLLSELVRVHPSRAVGTSLRRVQFIDDSPDGPVGSAEADCAPARGQRERSSSITQRAPMPFRRTHTLRRFRVLICNSIRWLFTTATGRRIWRHSHSWLGGFVNLRAARIRLSSAKPTQAGVPVPLNPKTKKGPEVSPAPCGKR